MSAITPFFPALFGALITTAASAKPPGALPTNGQVVGTAQGYDISAQVLNVVQRSADEPLVDDLSDEELGQLLEGFAMSQWLYDEAVARKLYKDPEIQVSIALATRQVLAAALLDQVSEAIATEESIAAWYAGNAQAFATPAARVRHILVEDEAGAVEVLMALSAGGDFTALAQENSVDPGSGSNGGDLGWITRDQVVVPFGDAVFDGDKPIMGPVESQFGFHVLEVLERSESVPLEVVHDEIADELRDGAMRQLIDRARSEAVFEVTRAGAQE